jgi:tetratricopeptide (TPR) repeat protein
MTTGTRSSRDTVWFLVLLAVLVAVVGIGWQRRSSDPLLAVKQALAEAPQDHRIHPWKIPDAAWVPQRIVRQGSLAGAKTARLLRAEALIAEKIASSSDSKWRALAAQAAMLDNKPAVAIELLGGTSSKTSEEFAILAAAHAMRSSIENRPSELGAAVEHAVRALDANQNNLAARFTLALAFENLSMVPESIEEWRRYLEVERDGSWRAEVMAHLDALERIRAQRTDAIAKADPSGVLLDTSPVQLLSDRPKAQTAGALVADRDPWLKVAASEPVDSALLLEAARENSSDHYDAVAGIAARAAPSYANAPAHAARLQLELVFAHNRLRHVAACIELAQRLDAQPYNWIRVQALSHRSGCLRMKGDNAGALRVQREAIALAQAKGLEALAIRASGVLVFQLTESGDLWRAWQENRTLLQSLQTGPYSVNRIHQCLANYSSAAERRGWPAAAAVFMRAAANTLANTGRRTSEAANRTTAAALANRAGLVSMASRETKLASELLASEPDSAAKSGASESLRIIAAEAWLELGRAQEALAGVAGLSDSLTPVERRRAARVRGLAQAMLGNDAESLRFLEPAFQSLQAAMSGMHRAEASAMRREHHQAYRTQAQLHVRAGETQRALEVWLRANGGDPQIGVPDLVWLRMEDGYAVWSHGSQFRRIRVAHASLDGLIQRIIAGASNPQQQVPGQEVSRLRRILFDETDPCPSAPGRELSILPDGSLAAIPFAMLTDRCAVVLSSSPGGKALPAKIAQALVVHNPETPESLPYLSDALTEADAARSYAGDGIVLTGREATRETVLSGLRGTRLFHFAGHGYSLPGAGGLYLSDGLLSADSIRVLDLGSCQVVVLSACSTGSGETSGLANSHSLVRSFLDAGARHVIASRWNVDSAATSLLMRSFYRQLSTMHHPAEALKTAISEIRSQPQHSHPYYWAAFQLHQ